MVSPAAASRPDAQLRESNRRFYDPFWSAAELVAPERFNTWPLVASLARPGQARLEVGPGLRPRLPLAGTAFADPSTPAVRKLRARGALAVAAEISALPFPDPSFELVAALDVVEHVDDEDRALHELARVTAAGATLLVSVPLHPERWTRFDELVGHRRRYEPERVRTQLARHGFAIEASASYGMQPACPRLVAFGLWALEHRPRRAHWLYANVILPLGLRLQKELELSDGMIATERVDEIFLLCLRQPGGGAQRHG
jgi:SAM-dependent methyltransferase